MKRIVLLFIILTKAHALTYFGSPTEAKTLQCAQEELISISNNRYPFLKFTELIEIKNKDFLHISLRKVSTYEAKAKDKEGKIYKTYIKVYNYEYNKYLNGEKITKTRCHLHMPACKETILGLYSLKIWNEFNELVMSHWVDGCALKQKKHF